MIGHIINIIKEIELYCLVVYKMWTHQKNHGHQIEKFLINLYQSDKKFNDFCIDTNTIYAYLFIGRTLDAKASNSHVFYV